VFEGLGGCAAPPSKVKESLKSLKLPSPTINASLSLIQTFRNLVDLRMNANCDGTGGEPKCIFILNNDNVTELAKALPEL